MNALKSLTISVILSGSHVRGSFKLVEQYRHLVIVDGESSENPAERIDVVLPCIIATEAPIESLMISREELQELKEKNPTIVDAINSGMHTVTKIKHSESTLY